MRKKRRFISEIVLACLLLQLSNREDKRPSNRVRLIILRLRYNGTKKPNSTMAKLFVPFALP
jgi:hypothetical protein